MFTSERHDYSNLISRAESQDETNEEKLDEVIDQLFNQDNRYLEKMEEKSNEIKETDVHLRKCSSKRKKLETISEKIRNRRRSFLIVTSHIMKILMTQSLFNQHKVMKQTRR